MGIVDFNTCSVAELQRPIQFADLGDEWSELLENSHASHVFCSWEWLFSWWEHLAEDRQLKLLTVRNGGHLVGILPLAVRHGAWHQMPPMRTVELIGSGTAGSDYLDVIARRGEEQLVVDALAEYLVDSGDVLYLRRLRRGTATARQLMNLLDERGWQTLEQPEETCPYVRLQGHTWDSYLHSLGGQHRSTFRRKHRKLEQQFNMRFVRAKTETERRRYLEILFELHNRRWQERTDDSEAFQTPEQRAFHDAVTVRTMKRDWLRLYVLWLGDTPAAVLYGFRHGSTFSFFQSGFDPAYARYSVGLVTMGLAIKAALEEGLTEYDMLHGTEPYKFHWAGHVRHLVRLEGYPAGARGYLYRGGADFTRSARRLARNLLHAKQRFLGGNAP